MPLTSTEYSRRRKKIKQDNSVELRHYYSTYINYLVKEKELTEKEHRKICDMMNHSYEENKKYAYCL